VVLLSLLFLSACGGGSSATNGQAGGSQTVGSQTTPTAPTVTMSAGATQVVVGGSLTLTVVASNATQFVISDNCDTQTTTVQATGVAQPVQVTAPTTPGTCTYTATASGTGGQASVTSGPITVQPSTATTVSMTASQQTIAAGQPVTLTVTVANANSVYITNNVTNASIPVAAAGGTASVNPAQSTTYTVTATGANNQQATAQVTIAVVSVSVSASPTAIVKGQSTTLTVTAANASQVVISDNTDSNTYALSGTGGTQAANPTVTTIYTATATSGSVTATAKVTVAVYAAAAATPINHVIFLMQENRTFDTYFGMLNPYRQANGYTLSANGYDVDGLTDANGVVGNFPTSPSGVANPNPNSDDEGDNFSLFWFATTCVDDMSSDWLASYGDVHKDAPWPLNRSIQMNGFVHTAENYAKNCQPATPGGPDHCGDGVLTDDLQGRRAMGYYDETYLPYYYYMASQFALSDRWFSPVASKSTPNRIATMTGGTTQGLVYDPFNDDKIQALTPPVGQLSIPTIFGKLDLAGVSWKIYYGSTQGGCTDPDGDCGNPSLTTYPAYPAITFEDFTDSYKYLHGVKDARGNPVPATTANCPAPTIPSSLAVGDKNTNTFCIDPTHIAPVKQYFADVANGTLPSFAFVEPAYGIDDEHPGSGQSILTGEAQVASMVNALMATASNPGYGSWQDSVFFLSYDEGGGPFDHVPPVPLHTNDFTNSALNITTDISSIAVNPDGYYPCPAPIDPVTLVQTPSMTPKPCDLLSHGTYADPGYFATDAASDPALGGGGQGFGAQLGFRPPT
jgi:phospholipase C